jgi:DNA-directed RNA polymerase subunit alpha
MNLISSNTFPIKTTFKKLDGNKSQFCIYPLNPGFGHTLGNAIRRVLISSIPGYAVSKIKINNFTHEFQAVEGILEDLQQVLLNVKSLNVKVSTDEDVVSIILRKSKGGVVTAEDFQKQAGVEIINKDMYICTIEKDFDLEIIAEVKRGYGFYQVDDSVLSSSQSLSDLYVDSLFSPIQNVSLEVEKVRVGDNTNLDKVIINFESNGTVDEKEAINYALKLLVDQYQKIELAFQTVEEPQEETFSSIVEDKNADVVVEEEVVPAESVETLGLTKTTTAHLIAHNIVTTADIIKQKEAVGLLIKSMKSKGDKEILSNVIAPKKAKVAKKETKKKE